jgi:hypothetical protein
MLTQTCLVTINDPTSAPDTTGPDVVALMGHHHHGNQVAKTDVTLVLNMIVALALVAAQNHAARIEITPVWARWGVAPAVIIPKLARHVAKVEVVPNLDLKVTDLAEAECSASHGDLGEAAPR